MRHCKSAPFTCLAMTVLVTARGGCWTIAAGVDMPEPSTRTDPIRQAARKEIDAGLFPGAVVLVGRPGRD